MVSKATPGPQWCILAPTGRQISQCRPDPNIFEDREIIMLEEGKAAPSFELPNEENEKVKLKDFQGQPLVLYFYPKADTPG